MKNGAVANRESIRCAVCTRKSTEEGLKQDFNSLDAQREECYKTTPRAWEQTSVLFASWRSYAECNGEAGGDVRKFGPMLSKRSFLPERLGCPQRPNPQSSLAGHLFQA